MHSLRRMAVAAVSLALLATSFGALVPGTEAASSTIDKKRQDIRERDRKIQQLEKKKKLAEQDKQEVLQQLEQKERELNELDRKVYESQEKVNAGRQKIAQIQKTLDERKLYFQGRVRKIYLQGELFYLRMLIEAESFSDFLKRFGLIIELVKADRRVLEEIRTTQGQLAATQQLLEKDLSELEKQKAEADRVFQELMAERKKHEKLIAKLESELEDLEEVNEAEKKELSALVAKAAADARRREQAGQAGPAYTGGKFYWPVDGGILTSPYGMRLNPVTGVYKMHEGIDIGALMGTPIKAAAPGQVIEARPSSGYGYIIVIYHGNGLSTLYAHMYAQTVKVAKGQNVSKGQVIAAVGSNGNSTGPHLHFEVQKNGNPVDPMPYFR
jgi:murein DD-endopeptidase MepM/ murein hydrolase activator NlpD